MSQEPLCPSCTNLLEKDRDVIAFDARHFRCPNCNKKWVQPAGVFDELIGNDKLTEVE